ncbi:MAG: hypothetical protein JW857_05990 [Bacteroidales bacterium]|nr:hypothetical protein [Bacteroidales bacterium]
MNSDQQKEFRATKSIRKKSWSYKEGFLIVFVLFFAGIIIEWVNGFSPLPELIFPQNLIIGIGFCTLLIAYYLLFNKSKSLNFLISIPAALSSISFFAINALIMGLFLQNPNMDGWQARLSFSNVSSSWYYVFSSLYILIVLGLVIINKLFQFKRKDLGVLISHLGLWLVIFAASMGSFDVTRLEMNLSEGEISYQATDRSTGKVYSMPFAFRLTNFILEEYPPKLGIVDNTSGTLLHEQGKNLRILEGDSTFQLMNWEVQILNYYETAGKAGKQYYFMHDIGAPPAVKVQAISNLSDTLIGWITCGSFNTQFESLKLDDKHAMIMLFPEPKNYKSEIDLLLPNGDQSHFYLEVNQPYTWDEWEIYQLSYDDEFGRWSDRSVVELVRDPWIKVVYTGIFLVLAGAIYLFWFGRSKKINS